MKVMHRTKTEVLLGIAGLAIVLSLAACRKKNEILSSGGGSSTQSVVTMKGGAR
jgi:hypothetical protein